MFAKYFISIPLLISTSIFASEQQDKNKLWSGSVDIGIDNFTGNTEEQNISGKIEIIRENQPWKWVNHAQTLYTESNSERTAEKYDFSTYLSYNFLPKSYVFGRAAYETDKFNGFDYQANAVTGLGWNIYTRKKFMWDAELGLGYRSSKVEDDALEDDRDELIGTASTTLNWQFSKNSAFKQYASFEVGEEITISYSSSEVIVKMIESLSFKLSYNVKHTSKVPASKEKVDTETIASLHYEF